MILVSLLSDNHHMAGMNNPCIFEKWCHGGLTTMNHFFQQSISELFDKLSTSFDGLSSSEANNRLKLYGLNVLPHGKRVTFLKVVLHQFTSPLIYVLIAAGVVSLLIGEYEDAGFIFLIIIINAILGTYQEWKAETNAAALQQLVKTKA